MAMSILRGSGPLSGFVSNVQKNSLLKKQKNSTGVNSTIIEWSTEDDVQSLMSARPQTRYRIGKINRKHMNYS